jgi:tRNA A-37 threonylcarbamoyl transferase component Bud32
MLIVSVDFDGTLALGNKSHITLSEPNFILIKRLKELKKTINVYIKIVTARGSKNHLSIEDKNKKYGKLIEEFCITYDVPYDEISFNKEYADLYIDDMTIDHYADFSPLKSVFTANDLIFTQHSVIKKSKTSLFEKEWFDIASNIVNVPKVLFCNDETIITERIQQTSQIDINQCINLLQKFKQLSIKNFNYQTYIDNIKPNRHSSKKVSLILDKISKEPLEPTFFHGDFTKQNIIVRDNDIFLIDPNYKYIFGNYITDAAKLYFSLIAYEKNVVEANRLVEVFGENIMYYGVVEGLRVCKYVPNYISIVNNIAEMS